VIAAQRILFAAFAVGLGLSITLAQSALAALTLVWLWRLRDPEIRRAHAWPLLLPVLAFAAVTLASALVSGHAGASLLASKGLLLMIALYVTADALADTGDAERFLTTVAVVAAIAGAIGLLQVAVCPTSARDTGSPAWLYHRCYRARGPFSIYMTLAGILMLTALATLPRLLPGGRRRLWFIPLWLVMLCGLIATYTRGAWLGFAAGVLALLPASRRGRVALVAGLAAVVVLLLLGPGTLRQRFLSMGDPEEATVKERRYMWESGLAMARQRPWLGVGPGGVKREYPAFALPQAIKKRTGHVHNTPLQILVERGALGLAAWLWIWIAFYAKAIAVLRRLAPDAARTRAIVLGSLAAITGFLIGGLSEYNFGDSEVAMLAWAIAALPWVIGRNPAEPRPDDPATRY
jgi:putative inorganic carbon (hco3(-)) transporter